MNETCAHVCGWGHVIIFSLPLVLFALPQHLIEYMENTVDIQHFTPMHGGMSIPWTTIQIPGISVLFDSQVLY